MLIEMYLQYIKLKLIKVIATINTLL